MNTKLLKISVLLSVVFLTVQISYAQTPAFKYQGSLTDGGSPANGGFQMQFKLFDAASGGTLLGTLTDLPVTATNGVFAVSLDFGAAALTGANRWLEIAVRRNSGESYITLSPREQISSAPYAVRTLSAATADVALDSQKLGGIDANQYVTTSTVGGSFIKNDTVQQTANFNISGNAFIGGNVGVGTATPGAKLDVVGGAVRSLSAGSTHVVAEMTGGTNGWSRFYAINPTQRWFLGTSRDFNGNQFYLVDETFGQSRMTIQPGGGAVSFPFGNVGIGTGSPAARLHVSNLGSTSAGILSEVNTTTAFAIRGQATAFNSVGVKGEANMGQGIGVWGQGDVNTGVFGLTSIGTGVYGRSTATNGLGRAFFAEGNAGQSADKGGFVKAMLFVKANGTIDRCYNGVTNVSLAGGGTGTTGCGFSVSGPSGQNVYTITFDFNVSSRFFSISPSDFSGARKAGTLFSPGASSISVIWEFVGGGTVASDFYLIVY